MTCQHCVNSVTEEVTRIDGVSSVTIDLTTGTVDIESAGELSSTELASAVEEAGYEVVPA